MSKRRLTTDELVAALIEEMRTDREQAKAERKADREAAERRQKEITDRLDGFDLALVNLGCDFRSFQAHALKNEDQLGKDLRAVADFVGMTNPPENGGR